MSRDPAIFWGDSKRLLGGKKGSEIWISGLGGTIFIPQPPADVIALLETALPRNLITTFDEDDRIHTQPTTPVLPT